MNTDNTDTTKYGALLALAHGDTPMTCAEMWDAMDPDLRPTPKTSDDEVVWSNLTSTMATLYQNHLVDRRKRDVRHKPYEYWLAAKGRQVLRENGDLPEDEPGSEPVAETTAAAMEMAASGDADRGYEVNDTDELNDLLSAVVEKVRELDTAVETLREDAVMEDELHEAEDDLHLRVDAINSALRDLEERVEDSLFGTGSTGGGPGAVTDLTDAAQMVEALQDAGYGLYEYDYERGYGGKTVEVRVTAKPQAKCDKRGPATEEMDQRLQDDTESATAAQQED